ncbi:hypothetical protein ACFQ9X_54190 [Catenulispora yoronensis]
MLVLAGVAAGGYVYSQGQYYVKPSSDGKQVLLYQGTTQLSFLASQVTLAQGPLYLSSVPADKRGDLTKTVTFGSEQAALTYLDQYRKAAKVCADLRHPGTATQSQAQTAPKQQVPPAPTSTEAKPGAVIGADPQTSPSTIGVVTEPTDSVGTASTGPSATVAPQSPNPPSTSASAPTTGGESQMQAFCAGTTDGP